MSEERAKTVADFLFEAMMLKRSPRSGYQFLGHGRETVAEHSYGTAVLAFVLARLNGEADLGKTVELALFHDLAEARTGDMNYMNKRYVQVDEDQAWADAAEGLPFGPELMALWEEWKKGESLEARLAADADQLDMILELMRLEDLGSCQARDWLFYAHKRLKTEEGKKLYDEINSADPSGWWFIRREEYWVRK